MTSTSRSMTMYFAFRAANLEANWELVRLRYESQPVSSGSNTLVGTAGVALAVPARARVAARVARMRVIRGDIVSSLDGGCPFNRRPGDFLRQERNHTVAHRGRQAQPAVARPPAKVGDLRARDGLAAQACPEHRHPHLDALERGRRAHLGERLDF